MSVISKQLQQAIMKAIELQGPCVLKQKDLLCQILEDLVPQLITERAWFEKSYHRELGDFLWHMYEAEAGEKPKICLEAEAYLEQTAQQWEDWGRQLTLQIMRESAMKTVAVKSFREYKPALATLLRKYGETLSMDIVSCFVEENHLFTRFNLDETMVLEDMYKVAKEEKIPWNF